MTLADKLSYLMMQAGISQRQLAIDTNIERSTLTKILNGSTITPKIDTVHTLARYFGVGITDLLNDEYKKSLIKPMNGTKTLQGVLSKLIEHNGIKTLAVLSQYTNVPISVLSDILNEKTLKPNIQTLTKLSTFFNVTIPQLMGVDSISKSFTPEAILFKTSIPLIELYQVNGYITNNLTDVKKYVNYPGRNPDNNTFCIQITDNRFTPDFLPNQQLVVSTSKIFVNGDLIILNHNNAVSIYECLIKNTDHLTVREIGQKTCLKLNPEQVEVLGVVIKQIINIKN